MGGFEWGDIEWGGFEWGDFECGDFEWGGFEKGDFEWGGIRRLDFEVWEFGWGVFEWGGIRVGWFRASSTCCKVVSGGVALERGGFEQIVFVARWFRMVWHSREAVLSILAERCRVFEWGGFEVWEFGWGGQ